MKMYILFILVSIHFQIISSAQIPDIRWEKTYGGSGDDILLDITQDSNDGFITCGISDSKDGDVTGTHDNGDAWIAKITANGKLQWQKSYGGSIYDGGTSVQKTVDRGYIIAGYTFSNDGDILFNHGNSDFWIIKVDSDGKMEWNKTLGGSGYEDAFSIQQTNDGGYITTGYSNSVDGDVTGNHGDYDYWVVKLNSFGNIQWQKSFGGSGFDFPNSIKQTTDGGYIIAGLSSSTDGDISDHHDDRNALYN